MGVTETDGDLTDGADGDSMDRKSTDGADRESMEKRENECPLTVASTAPKL